MSVSEGEYPIWVPARFFLCFDIRFFGGYIPTWLGKLIVQGYIAGPAMRIPTLSRCIFRPFFTDSLTLLYFYF